MKSSETRCSVLIWTALTLSVLSLGACATKPSPNAPDGRPCYPAVLDSETAMLLRAAHLWDVRMGDLITTRECALQDSDDRLNETYRLTR